MSEVLITKIIQDVEMCMDEIADNDSEFETPQDDSERDNIVRSKINDALRFVYANADFSLLDADNIVTQDSEDIDYSINNGSLVFELPSDYLRLMFAKFSSWPRTLSEEDIIYWTDKRYAQLSDPYATGTHERPRIAMGISSAGKKQLEMYASKYKTGKDAEDNDEPFVIGYIGEPSAITATATNVEIQDKVYRAVIYYITGLVFETYAEADKAQLMHKTANDLMGFTVGNVTGTTN